MNHGVSRRQSIATPSDCHVLRGQFLVYMIAASAHGERAILDEIKQRLLVVKGHIRSRR